MKGEETQPEMTNTYWDKNLHSLRRGALGFSVLRIWPISRSVFRFSHTQKLQFFSFGIFCGLWFLLLLSIGFRFSAKILAVFQIWYKM